MNEREPNDFIMMSLYYDVLIQQEEPVRLFWVFLRTCYETV